MTFSTNDQLNWGVSSAALTATLDDGQQIPVFDKVAQVRDDNGAVLGITSPSYEIYQNNDLKNLITPMVDEGLLEITNIGYLGKGEKVFIQAQMAQEYKIVGEAHRARITLLNAHDGSAALAAGVTDHRVICSNTFAMAMTDLDKRLRHTADIHTHALEITQTIDYVNENMMRFRDASETLAHTNCDDAMLDTLIAATYKKPVENVRAANSIRRFFREGAGNEGVSLWDGLNAITQYTTHSAMKDDGKRFASVNFGANALRNRTAMNAALALV